MFHHLFFVMSLSGSAVFLLYGLTYPITRRLFSPSWRRNILCLSLFFYLAPLPLLKEFALSQLHIDLPFLYEDVHIDLQYSLCMQHNRFIPGSDVIISSIVMFCMAVIASAVIIKQLKEYVVIYRTYLMNVFYDETLMPQLEKMLQQTKEELQIKKTVRLICSRLCDAPMTIGVFKPVIVFPTSDKLNLGLNDIKYILKHELLHIKNKDLLLKFLAFATIAVHWYNPICYLLYNELCVVSEMNCDDGVIKGAGDTQRQQYSHLILDLAAASSSKKARFAVGLANNDTTTLERRILEMKETKKNAMPILSCIVAAMICIAGTITAFAYDAPKKYVTDDLDWESEITFSISGSTESVEQLAFDYFFTDKDGNITALHNLPQRILCKHEYVEGTVTKHAKKSDGGCTVTVKSAKRCKYCGHTIEGGIISETKYTVCPQ